MKKKENAINKTGTISTDATPMTAKRKIVSKNGHLPILLRLTRRMTVFLFLTLVAILIFFITGSRQHFLDSNLLILLQAMSYNAIALDFFATAAALQSIFYLVRLKKNILIVHVVCYLLVFIFSSAAAIFSLSLTILSEGIPF